MFKLMTNLIGLYLEIVKLVNKAHDAYCCNVKPFARLLIFGWMILLCIVLFFLVFYLSVVEGVLSILLSKEDASLFPNICVQ